MRTRRIRFSYSEGSLQRHFVDRDLVMSHVLAHLSTLFPEDEDFFVRSVRRFADQRFKVSPSPGAAWEFAQNVA